MNIATAYKCMQHYESLPEPEKKPKRKRPSPKQIEAIKRDAMSGKYSRTAIKDKHDVSFSWLTRNVPDGNYRDQHAKISAEKIEIIRRDVADGRTPKWIATNRKCSESTVFKYRL